MDESVLLDVDVSVLRQLGLWEGDIIKVMCYFDNCFGCNKKNVDGDVEGGGFFFGLGGVFWNNIWKGWLVLVVQMSDVVDFKVFLMKDVVGEVKEEVKFLVLVVSFINGV